MSHQKLNSNIKENTSKIPNGVGCFGCPYYSHDDKGFKTHCLKYNEMIYSDGFRGIKTELCKKDNKK